MGLYPSIPHKAIRDKREQHTILAIELIRMTDFILKNNYFEFNGQIKQQFSGTAIGTMFAPPYAYLFMDKIEIAFLETQELQTLVWFRYIDNIFLFGHMVSKNFKLFCVVLMNSILTSNLLMSQAKKAFHFLILKLVLKTVRLLQICMWNLLIAINISITCLLIQTTPNDL